MTEFKKKINAPERVIVKNRSELYKKLDEAEEDIRLGKVHTVDEVFDRLRDKYEV
ncbi:MAG: hypothetical protein ACI4YB_08930 [Oscillospiraceae bacterium]